MNIVQEELRKHYGTQFYLKYFDEYKKVRHQFRNNIEDFNKFMQNKREELIQQFENC